MRNHNSGWRIAHPVARALAAILLCVVTLWPAIQAGAQSTGPTSLQAVAPSKQMVPTELGPVKMSRPDNWEVTLPEKEGQFVRIAPKDGVTGDALGYGMMLNGFTA